MRRLILLLALTTTTANATPLSPQAQLGQSLFFNPSLSASGQQSCASCHDPANHYAPTNSLAVQPGGPHMNTPGFRATPSLTYIDQAPPFRTDLENPDGTASGPGGGLDWDGRSNTIAQQALRVLTTSYEMANSSEAALVQRVKANPETARAFQKIFGPTLFQHPHQAFEAIGTTLEAFIREDPSFHPYTSKYDAYTRGTATLTRQEERGMAIFNDAERANCASCHTAGQGPGRDGLSSGQFTDFFFRNLATPRNPTIDTTAIGGQDLGLCGPLRTDLTPQKSPANTRYCGLFATPTLRNVATRHVFMHNGAFHSLRDVVEFYLTRDITPGRWYPSGTYDDLPPEDRQFVDRTDMPFTTQHPDAKPAISEQDVNDLLAFLETLTDGYRPPPR